MCGSYMFEFNVSEDMKKKRHNKRDGSREGTDTFMSNTNCQKNWKLVLRREGDNNTKYNQTLHILCSVVTTNQKIGDTRYNI